MKADIEKQAEPYNPTWNGAANNVIQVAAAFSQTS